MHNAPLVIMAVVSVATASISGFEHIVDANTPPPIEGWAERLSSVQAGEVARIEWHITKRIDCPGVSGRVWKGEDNFYMVEPYRKTALPMMEGEITYRIQTEIPSLAPEGDLLLTIEGYYDCPNKRIEYSIGPVELTVVTK